MAAGDALTPHEAAPEPKVREAWPAVTTSDPLWQEEKERSEPRVLEHDEHCRRAEGQKVLPVADERAARCNVGGRHMEDEDEECAIDGRACSLLSELSRTVCSHDAPRASVIFGQLEDLGTNVACALDSWVLEGNGLLHWSVSSFPDGARWLNAAATARLLVERKCDPCKPNTHGESPLLLAVRAAAALADEVSPPGAGLSKVIQALVVARADPNAGDERGETALMEAACSGSIELCQVLIDARADVSQVSESNLTAMDFAADDPVISGLFAKVVKQLAHSVSPASVAEQPAAAVAPPPPPPPSLPPPLPPSPPVPPDSPKDERATQGPSPAALPAAPAAAPATEAAAAAAAQTAAVPAVATAEWPAPSVSMSDLMARARRCLPAPAATQPEKAVLGFLSRRKFARLVDPVRAHAALVLTKRLAEWEPLHRNSSVTLSQVLGYRDADGHTLLHLCILAPVVEGTPADAARVLELLVSAGASVNAANLKGETPLLLAVREMQGGNRGEGLMLIRTLLDCKANPNLADSRRLNPLFEAACMQDRKLLEFLLARGGSLFLRGGQKNRSPFEELCASAPTLAAYLAGQPCAQDAMPEAVHLTREMDGGAPPVQGTSPQERLIASMCNEVQGHNAAGVREILTLWEEESWRVSRLMDWYDQDGNGWLHLSLLAPPMEEHWRMVGDVVNELLANLADANRANNSGETPVWLVAREASGTGEGRLDLMHDLLAFSATCDHVTLGGHTALMEAVELGDAPMCKALLLAGADPDWSLQGTAPPARRAAANPELAVLFRLYSKDERLHAAAGGRATTENAPAPCGDVLSTFKHHVMLHNSQRISSSLSKCGFPMALLTHVDKDGNTPLHLCLLAPPVDTHLVAETAETLLLAKADPNAANSAGETPLLMAVREIAPHARQGQGAAGRLRIVNLLVRAKANLEARDSQGLTVMAEACLQDDLGVVELLVGAGGRLEGEIRGKGKKAMDLAPARGAVRRQFADHAERGVGPGDHTLTAPDRGKAGAGTSRAQALIQAVQAHDAGLLSEILASYKADGRKISPLLGVQDADGHGLLHLCIIAPPAHLGSSALLETAKVLLAAKADTNAANSLGETPLLLVVREMAGTGDESRVDLARALMKSRAEADIGDTQDTTPLMEAALLGDAEICRILLDRGADMRRCGAGGLSARELASKFPAVQQVFDDEAEMVPDEEDEDEESQPVQVTLRHALTQHEREITVAGNATVGDIKKAIVRLSHGSWRRIALLTEQGRALHDTEYLNGRSQLIMADVKSAEARRAAEEALPEEERWKRWSLGDLKAEADRRGVFGGNTKEQVLEGLLEVKRWECLPAKELRLECSKRGLAVDACPDKDELVLQLKQDLSWEMMEERELRLECEARSIPLPGEKDLLSMARAMRSRLRQVLRWEMLPEAQLRSACELRNYNTECKARKELLAFLKSFRTLQKANVKAKPKAEPTWRTSGADGGHSRENSAQSDVDEVLNPCPPGFSERVKKLSAKHPGFTGNYPPNMDEWDDQEIEYYFYSNGKYPSKPHRRSLSQVPEVPKSLHYKTLELPDGAPVAEVKRAYRRLALQHHPDKNLKDPKAAEEQFKAITEAYEALMESVLTPCCGECTQGGT